MFHNMENECSHDPPRVHTNARACMKNMAEEGERKSKKNEMEHGGENVYSAIKLCV